LYVILLNALAASACGSNGQDPLVGTWTYSGNVPAIVTINLAFKSDKTFTFVEEVAPPTTPAGSVPNGCVVTQTFSAAYAETVSAGMSTLTWTFTGGMANVVAGCNDASNNSPGTPMTADAVASYTDQGLIPPTTVSYTVTSTTLVLASTGSPSAGVGRSPGTTFTKSP
jgi:hypothetical protein